MFNLQRSSLCAVKLLTTKAEAKMLETSAVSSSHGVNMKKKEGCPWNSYADHEQHLQFGSSFRDERLLLIIEANSMTDEKKRQNTSGCHRSQSRFSMLLMLLITTLANKHSDKTLTLFTEAV